MNRLKKELTKIKNNLDNYRVHESYRQIEKSIAKQNEIVEE